MKQIFSKIWLLWGALVFLVTWPFVWLAYQLARIFNPGEKIYPAAFAVTKVWGHIVLFLLGVNLKVFGKEKNGKGRQVVYVSNHRSQIDIPVNFVSTPRFVILSKHQALKIPVVATNLKLAHVTVNRKDKASRKQSLLELKEHLKAGRSILLYPEGRRPREDVALGEFHDGAFLLAKEFALPIVPITIVDSDKINNPKNPIALLPGKVEVFFDEMIEVTKDTDLGELKERVMNVMLKRLA